MQHLLKQLGELMPGCTAKERRRIQLACIKAGRLAGLRKAEAKRCLPVPWSRRVWEGLRPGRPGRMLGTRWVQDELIRAGMQNYSYEAGWNPGTDRPRMFRAATLETIGKHFGLHRTTVSSALRRLKVQKGSCMSGYCDYCANWTKVQQPATEKEIDAMM